MTKLEIFKYGIIEDFGREFYLQILSYKNISFLQISFDIADLEKWFSLPYIHISFGHGTLFSCLICISKFGFSFDVFGTTWRR